MRHRSAVLTATRALAIVDRPRPTPQPHQVLVRIEAVGICGSDVHCYEQGRIGQYVVEAPTVIGPRLPEPSPTWAPRRGESRAATGSARRAVITAGDRVMVTGAGPIGLLTAQVARAFGALDVTVSDISEFRLSVARGLGFSVQRVGETQSREFDVLLECSGTQSALTAGVARSTEPGGSS